jgi:hypothetical protein
MTTLLLGNRRRSAMPIETDFAFAQEPAASLVAAADLLGLLRGFVGHHPAQKPQRTGAQTFNTNQERRIFFSN